MAEGPFYPFDQRTDISFRLQKPYVTEETASRNVGLLMAILGQLGNQQIGSLVLSDKPRFTVFHRHNTGAVITFAPDQDCYLVGWACPNGELFIDMANEGASGAIVGGNDRVPSLIGYANLSVHPDAAKTLVRAGENLYINTNSGPRMSQMTFELA